MLRALTRTLGTSMWMLGTSMQMLRAWRGRRAHSRTTSGRNSRKAYTNRLYILAPKKCWDMSKGEGQITDRPPYQIRNSCLSFMNAHAGLCQGVYNNTVTNTRAEEAERAEGAEGPHLGREGEGEVHLPEARLGHIKAEEDVVPHHQAGGLARGGGQVRQLHKSEGLHLRSGRRPSTSDRETPKGPRHRLQTANQGVQYVKRVHGLPSYRRLPTTVMLKASDHGVYTVYPWQRNRLRQTRGYTTHGAETKHASPGDRDRQSDQGRHTPVYPGWYGQVKTPRDLGTEYRLRARSYSAEREVQFTPVNPGWI
eukprot:1195326-Prorocentrum_minimum.AAC.6